MSLRRFVVFALLGAGLGLVALSWRSADSGRDTTVPPAGVPSQAAPSTAPSGSAASVSVVLPARTAAPPSVEPANEGEEALDDEGEDEAGVLQADRVALLTAAGFSVDRAAYVVRRETELRIAAASDEYAATGTVRALTGSVQSVSTAQLRAEIGDEEFERYLEALGRPTSVVVGAVEPSSAAANAGLSPGDEIVAYAGQRVFNARDLNALTQQRGIGETVPATVVRDGQRLQLYVTGGPLGLVPARDQP